METKEKDKKLEKYHNQSDLSRYFKITSDTEESINLRDQNQNKIVLQTSLRNITSRKAIQSTLFEKNITNLKISKNIKHFDTFWQEIFPDIISPHLALDSMHIMGITDNNSNLEQNQMISKITTEHLLLSPVMLTLNKIIQKFRFDDIKITLYNKSLLLLEPLSLKFKIFIDTMDSIKTQNIKTYKGQVNRNLYPEYWGESFISIDSGVIMKKSGKISKIFIIEQKDEYLNDFLKRKRKKIEYFFSISQLHTIFKTLKEYQQYSSQNKLQSNETEEKILNSIEIDFYTGFVKFVLKYQNQKRSKWGIFLAGRVEKD